MALPTARALRACPGSRLSPTGRTSRSFVSVRPLSRSAVRFPHRIGSELASIVVGELTVNVAVRDGHVVEPPRSDPTSVARSTAVSGPILDDLLYGRVHGRGYR